MRVVEDDFWTEGTARRKVETGDPADPATISARAYLTELRDAFQSSADALTADLALAGAAAELPAA